MLRAPTQKKQNVLKWSFENTISNNIDSTYGSVIALGAGMTVNQNNGNLTIAAGTTAFAETIIRSKESTDMQAIFRYGLILSQRIANNNFIIELTDVFGDALPITVSSATSAQILKPAHGLTARDIGKGVWIGALTVPNNLSQRVTIASIVDADNFTVTGTGMTAGSGLCSMFGFNNYQVIYSGTTATALGTGVTTSRRGWQNTVVNATIASTAGVGHTGVIESLRQTEAAYSDMATGSGVGSQLLTRATFSQNVPEGCDLSIQIRVLNGAVAPASSTNLTIPFIDIQVFEFDSVNVAGVEAIAAKSGIPVIITNVTPGVQGTALQIHGQSADNGAPNYNPITVAGQARSTNPSAYTAGNIARVFQDLVGRQVCQIGNVPQLQDQSRITLSTTTETTLIAAVASVRHGIHGLTIANRDTVATTVDIRDTTAGTIRQTFVVPPGVTNFFPFDFGLWQLAVNTNFTAQLRAATTTNPVEISAISYRVSY